MFATLAALLISAFGLLIGMLGVVWWRQERITYQPPREWLQSPTNVRRIEYTAVDGEPLFAFVLEPDAAAAGLLLAFHGNADLAVWQIPWAREAARRTGWCVVLAEYRGYGGLSGVPSYQAVREDARAAWRAAQRIATELQIPKPAFALFGHSLGSAVATELAVETCAVIHCPDRSDIALQGAAHALVLQSPFTSARDMARIVSTRPVQMLWRIISRVHYDTRARLRETSVPVWIAHGARDRLVPVTMGRELFTRARMPGELLVVEYAGHNDVPEIAGENYWRWLGDALSDRPAMYLEAGPTRHTEISD